MFVVRAVATDPDPLAMVRLQVDVKPLGQPFSPGPFYESELGASGDTSWVLVDSLHDDTDDGPVRLKLE